MILREIVHAVSRFPLHFMLYRENLDCFLTVRGIDEQSEQSQQTKNRQQLYLVPVPILHGNHGTYKTHLGN